MELALNHKSFREHHGLERLPQQGHVRDCTFADMRLHKSGNDRIADIGLQQIELYNPGSE